MVCQLMMIINCFCGMVDRRKVFSLISSRDHCQRSSPSRISDTPRAGFEPVQNLGSGSVEWNCAVVITTTLRCHWFPKISSIGMLIIFRPWVLFLSKCFRFFLKQFFGNLRVDEGFHVFFRYKWKFAIMFYH